MVANARAMAAAAAIIELRDEYLPVCRVNNAGLVANHQTMEYINSQRLTSIRNFKNLKGKDIGRLVKSFVGSNLVAGQLRYTTQKNLEGMAYWVTDRIRTNMTLIAAEWDANALEEAKEANDIAIERRANPQTPKRIEKISTGFNSHTWNEKWENYLNSIMGVGGYHSPM